MSLEAGLKWSYKDIKLVGYSIAGVSTTVAFPQADVCFDVAQGLPFLTPVTHILLTHGHMDHAGGLPYLLGQKAMRGTKPPKVYMPEPMLVPMQKIMELWSQIEGHTFNYTFQPVRPGEEAPLKGSYFFRPFPTFHRVPSQGYTVFQRKKRLRPEFNGLSPTELGHIRRQGRALDELYDEPVLSFTGDTRIEFTDSTQVQNSRVLLMEVTYWDDRKGVEQARSWGHTHFHEFLTRLDQLNCEKIVLIHTSARYSTRALQELIDEYVPEPHRARVELFPRPS